MTPFVEIPWILAAAEWVWGADPNVSPEFCLSSFSNLLSKDCLTGLVVKGLGVAIILGACLNKAPIIINIIKSSSCAGLSLNSIYGDAVIYFNAAFYGFLNGHPISAYGENLGLGIQTLIMVGLMWKLQKDPVVSMQERIVATAMFLIYCYACLVLLPEEYYYILMASVWPVLMYARGSQILKTYQVKHTGAQSILTLTMNVVGALIRVFTTIKEVGWDMNVLNGYFLSVACNATMFAQYWYYRDNTLKFMAELDKKKEE